MLNVPLRLKKKNYLFYVMVTNYISHTKDVEEKDSCEKQQVAKLTIFNTRE